MFSLQIKTIYLWRLYFIIAWQFFFSKHGYLRAVVGMWGNTSEEVMTTILGIEKEMQNFVVKASQ